ncbi:MAG: jacalin-like lectin [Anaerolineae bacterium]
MNAWWDDSSGFEIGDICNFRYQQLNGYTVQLEWSNRSNACILTPFQRTGQVGGSGGAAFADDLTGVQRLTGLTIRHGKFVDALRCSWQMTDGSTRMGAQHGGNGGTQDVITFATGENIVGISGRSGAYIDQLVITTNTATYGPYGGNGGSPFNLGPVAAQTIGFFGRSGLYLDALGAISLTH